MNGLTLYPLSCDSQRPKYISSDCMPANRCRGLTAPRGYEPLREFSDSISDAVPICGVCETDDRTRPPLHVPKYATRLFVICFFSCIATTTPRNNLIRRLRLHAQTKDGEIISMQPRISKLAQIAAGTAVLAMAFSLPAAANEHYGHWRRMHHHHYSQSFERPLTVSKHRQREPIVATPDPFHGPGAIITGPNAIAATIVSLPFRVVGAVFPPYGNPAANPLVLIGAPVHVAGEIAEFPFYVVGSAFGAPPYVVY